MLMKFPAQTIIIHIPQKVLRHKFGILEYAGASIVTHHFKSIRVVALINFNFTLAPPIIMSNLKSANSKPGDPTIQSQANTLALLTQMNEYIAKSEIQYLHLCTSSYSQKRGYLV